LPRLPCSGAVFRVTAGDRSRPSLTLSCHSIWHGSGTTVDAATTPTARSAWSTEHRAPHRAADNSLCRVRKATPGRQRRQGGGRLPGCVSCNTAPPNYMAGFGVLLDLCKEDPHTPLTSTLTSVVVQWGRSGFTRQPGREWQDPGKRRRPPAAAGRLRRPARPAIHPKRRIGRDDGWQRHRRQSSRGP